MTLSVFIATPSLDMQVHASYHDSIVRLLMQGFAEWHPCTRPYDGDIVRVRSRYVADFLESPCSHLLFIDADMDFHRSVIEAMVRQAEKGDDFVAAKYPRKLHASGAPVGGSSVVGGVGLTLLSRECLRRMVDHYGGELWATDDDGREVVQVFALMFTPEIVKDGRRKRRLLSEDYSFGARWQAIGGDVTVVTPAPDSVGHNGVWRWT